MRRNYIVMIAGACVLIVVVVVMLRLMMGGDDEDSSPLVAETPALPATGPATPLTDTTLTSTVESAMAAFFKKAPVPTHAAVPLERFEGTWEARIVSADIDGDNGPLRDTSAQKPFSITIKSDGGAWMLVAADGHGQPRMLAATLQGVVARADAAPEISLSLRGEKMIGVMDVSRPAQGRLEFHATKQP